MEEKEKSISLVVASETEIAQTSLRIGVVGLPIRSYKIIGWLNCLESQIVEGDNPVSENNSKPRSIPSRSGHVKP